MMLVKTVKIMGGNQVALWLGLNLLDLVLSIVSLNYGARELPMLAWLLEKMQGSSRYIPLSLVWYGSYKMGLTALVLLGLDRMKKLHLLKLLNIGLGCICLYIIAMLIKTFS